MNFYAVAIWSDIKRNAVAFWYHPTIKEMQAQMLREIPAIHIAGKCTNRALRIIYRVRLRVLGDEAKPKFWNAAKGKWQ